MKEYERIWKHIEQYAKNIKKKLKNIKELREYKAYFKF